MRAIPPALQVKLDSGATTLCRCWLITRRDGIVQGFTDHDETVLLAGTPCLADTGLNASEATERLGMQIDGAELSGALVHDSLTEADLAAGRYDAATVETWLVDWSDPDLRVLLATGVLGEVRREARPSPPRCARSPIVSIRKAAGSIPPPARPISAMRAAGSILRSRFFAAWARLRRCRAHPHSWRAG